MTRRVELPTRCTLSEASTAKHPAFGENMGPDREAPWTLRRLSPMRIVHNSQDGILEMAREISMSKIMVKTIWVAVSRAPGTGLQ